MGVMKKFRRGFTLIEVTLFLAVTSVLFVGVTIGVQNSIFQQRFSDSVQNFIDFVRNVYSEVASIQSDKIPGPSSDLGRTEQAVYGRIMLFGESMYPNGCPANDSTFERAGCDYEPGRNVVFVYDVLGDISDIGTGNIVDSLVSLHANVVVVENDSIRPAGIVENYSPRWNAQIEGIGSFDDFKGAILVARHPRSGSIYTIVRAGESLEINRDIFELNQYISSTTNGVQAKIEQINTLLENNLINRTDDLGGYNHLFGIGDIDFCINPMPNESYSSRRDVRVIANARNGSGVDMIAEDLGPGEYKCGM